MSDTPTFLIVDDDETFTHVLSRALKRRGFEPLVANSAEQAGPLLSRQVPDYATLDLKMDGASGITLIPELIRLNPQIKILILTGYASISTAVEAIKLGAKDYLTKPADADEILAKLNHSEPDPNIDIAEKPMSVGRLEWEHIQKVLGEHDGNISATARALGMHRRTLQRKLVKRPVKE
ncbi:response regulator transcription factor [Aliamphritea spongicola]|uniref:response regulator transcription factor n=1 Tax=Aliamphritea spongicola TaxID=707589 RepID=UPI00196A7424|nr:response regulator transcription factor [Aliamphritea spongicola]MBN3563889.1 response regulator transcription factor [Aliamphritea spongicola]